MDDSVTELKDKVVEGLKEQMSAAAMADPTYMQACRASWTQLEENAGSYFERFKASGCQIMMLVSDDYDREYSWHGVKNSQDLRANYHESHNPSNHSRVLIAMDLGKGFEEQWPYAPGTVTLPHLRGNPVITFASQEEIDAFDKPAYEDLSPEEKVAIFGRIVFDFQLPSPQAGEDGPQDGTKLG